MTAATIGREVGAAIGAALTGRIEDHRAACRGIVVEWGGAGIDEAVRIAARIAAMHAERGTGELWAPRVDEDRLPPAVVCARRIVAARVNGDHATVDALLLAARAHRYQYGLLLAVTAVAAAAHHGGATAGGVVRP